MIPRPPPVNVDWDMLRALINNHFMPGDQVELWLPIVGPYKSTTEPRKEKFTFVKVDGVMVMMKEKVIGLLCFYCWVDADLPTLTNSKMSGVQWLLSGYSPGIRNIDILAYLWAKNDGLMPKDESDQLRSLINESNRVVEPIEGQEQEVLELLDSYLAKHNTFLDSLIQADRMKEKSEH